MRTHSRSAVGIRDATTSGELGILAVADVLCTSVVWSQSEGGDGNYKARCIISVRPNHTDCSDGIKLRLCRLTSQSSSESDANHFSEL